MSTPADIKLLIGSLGSLEPCEYQAEISEEEQTALAELLAAADPLAVVGLDSLMRGSETGSQLTFMPG
jgi:hypothetical protein